MDRKRYSNNDVFNLLREIDFHFHDGLDIGSACRKAGISNKSCYYWRKKFGGLSRSQVSEMKSLNKENECFKKFGTNQCKAIRVRLERMDTTNALTERCQKKVLTAEWFHSTRQDRHQCLS
ncbi:transposase [Rhodobacteraceae bacterium IMCC15231]|nr:transposase [Rhodobacteraceae bacterium IMCC15231]